MVEPVTLGIVVSTLVAKALDKAGDKVLEEGEGVLGRLIGALRRRFGDPEDPGTRALERLEEAPDSPSRARELAAVLDERAAADTAFRDELEALVDEAKRAGLEVESIEQVASGNQNVQAAALVDSEVSVKFGGQQSDSPPPRAD